jgi:type IV pilus assembly protein PilY1
MSTIKTMRGAGRFAIATACFTTAVAYSSPALAAVPEVKIANGPLFNGSGNVHPNVLLSLSIEYPTVGIAYRGDGGVYNKTFEYVGYFNPLKCYRYTGGNRNLIDGYFSISKNADAAHECGGDSFSGNFMNWAGSSTIDMLRYALTGGDRAVDTADTTILQRAVLKEDFYANATYFPRRSVKAGGNASAPNRVTPFNPDTLYIVSCRNRILFSDSANNGNDCDTPAFDGNGALAKTDRKLGEYLARVKVCDSSEGADRTDLCQKYGNHYKPVGEIQRHAEKMRFAAMGYLLDDAKARYGGVLRTPMAYVGAKKFAEPGFSEAANDHPEWDAATGVLYNNPADQFNRAGTAMQSGIINYLNKFGRSGIYKTFDPVSELYYEGIRYFQGKQPTQDATTGMSIAMKDGFPVIETWKDPVTASCQRNYIVSIADVNTHWDRYLPGNNRTTFHRTENAHDLTRAIEVSVSGKTPELDVKLWTKKIADMEADTAGVYANPMPRAHLAGLQDKDTGSDGHGTYYMAGLAYWANTNDIRLDKPVRVKTFAIDVDEGGNGLIDGNSRAIKPRDSQLYLAAKYGGFDDRNNDGNPFITHAADGKIALKYNDAEWDRNGSSVPANYFLANQPKELIQSVRTIFSTVANSSGTMSGVSVSATKLSSDGASVYQPGFDASKWSGSLKKLTVSLDDTGAVRAATTASWDAAVILTGTSGQTPNPAAANRKIYTAKINADKTLSTVPFKWNDLAADQQTLLDMPPGSRIHDRLGEKRLDYLRGVRSLETGRPGGIFRARDSLLGDIINSSPVYVGAPAAALQGNDYNEFFEANKDRTKAVYVGANDGMLHAFGAADGNELFAYVPNAVIKELNQLTAIDYTHRPYVDGALTVGDALIAGKWKTILAAGMGGGAQGVFALDVTDPSRFGEGAGVIFEFTDSDDADMGNLVGAPSIAKFKTTVTKGIPEYRYFVVVPSGLNNYQNDGVGKFSNAAQGALFLLALDKRPSEKWQSGVNYYKFKMPIGDVGLPNGVAAPALAAGSDSAVRYAYAGDLQGNIWRFDFTGTAPWLGALGSAPYKPLFTARDAKDSRQPITTQPKLVFAPGGGYLVLFGTGKFVEDADAASGNFSTQSFYAIVDTTNPSYKIADRGELMPRLLAKNPEKNSDAVQIAGDAFTYGLTSEDKKGWYFDFSASDKTGERIVTNPLIAYGQLFFNSLIPGSDPCAAGGGRSYSVDTLTGLPSGGKATGYLSEVGLLSSPILFETAVETGDRNAIGKRSVKKKVAIFNAGTGGVKGRIAPVPNGIGNFTTPAGRFSWREIFNWQEMRDAFSKK